MKPVSQEKLWQAMRSVDPPRGAREKILTRLERELAPDRRRRAVVVQRLALACVLAAGSTLAAVGFHSWQVSQRAQDPTSTESVPVPTRSIRRELQPPEASASPAPPPAEPHPPVVTFPEATAPHKLPATPSHGPAPRNAVGTAAPETEPAKEPAKSATDPSSLSEQVSAYRRIAAMSDRSAAVQEWRAMLERWPSTTLRHEIELNLVDALSQLGRREEARQAAATFLRHFPKSPRAADVKRLLGTGTPKP